MLTHISSGYTSDKANMAPAEPAAACPIGGKLSFVIAIIDIFFLKKKER